MTVFVDTSAIIAVLDRRQPDNARAGDLWTALLDQDALLVTVSCVFVEAVALLQARLGIPALHDFQSLMLPYLDLHWLHEEAHLAALDQVLQTNRRELGLVDVASLQFMREHGLQYAFSFDRHFAEAGYPLPPLR